VTDQLAPLPDVAGSMGDGYDKHNDTCFGRTVHSLWFDILVVVLLLLDVSLVAFELGVELQVICIGGKIVMAESAPADPHAHYRLLRGMPGAEVSQFLPPKSDFMSVAADSHKDEYLKCLAPSSEEVEELEHHVHLASIAILTFFAIENGLKWYFFEGFLNECGHKLDVFVVYFSLILDVILLFISGNGESTKPGVRAEIIVGLLMLTRFWRVVRIVDGLYEASGTAREQVERNEEDKLELENKGDH